MPPMQSHRALCQKTWSVRLRRYGEGNPRNIGAVTRFGWTARLSGAARHIDASAQLRAFFNLR
jgi:hypothetical protein